jgi:choline dehydrogenase-like flavoprotein
VASRLANSASKPSVLLLEAGGPNSEPEGRIAGERHTYWITGGLSLDYGYKTIPQPALNGRELPYHRGKGLGGSSATNLGLWDWGAKSEFEEWARIVGDGTWEWANVVQHMKKVCLLEYCNVLGRLLTPRYSRLRIIMTLHQRSTRNTSILINHLMGIPGAFQQEVR